MIYNYYNPLYFTPFIPPNCQKPPTVYSILESIVNGNKEKEDYIKIRDLAKEGRSTIFYFDYPLSSNINKEQFECMILNHYMMRRIGFETVNAFCIQLNVKLNEIMPLYNKMFDAIENWQIFNDGEITTRVGENKTNRNSENNTTSNRSNENNTNIVDNEKNISNLHNENKSINTSHSSVESSNNINENTSTNSEGTSTNISDLRNSDLPQSQLDNIKNGSYVTDYNYNTVDNTTTGNETIEKTGTNTSNTNNTINGNIEDKGTSDSSSTRDFTSTNNTTGSSNEKINQLNTSNDNNNYIETITRTPGDKILIMKEIQENIKNIYSLIFNDLDILFYQLV